MQKWGIDLSDIDVHFWPDSVRNSAAEDWGAHYLGGELNTPLAVISESKRERKSWGAPVPEAQRAKIQHLPFLP